jgi:benzoate-CoA ligase family protein
MYEYLTLVRTMSLFEAIFKQDLLDRTAILYEQRQISYTELRHEALAVARVLGELGVARGERVALLLNDSSEFVAAFIAICSSGAIAVPINMALRLDEQEAILNDCSASVAVVEADLGKSLLADARKKLSHLRQVVLIGRDDKELSTENSEKHGDEDHGKADGVVKHWSFAELMSQARVAVADNAADKAGFPEPEEDQPAFILYTSGSTGEPKGAVHRQADIFHTNETYCREVLRLREGDRLFSSSRLPFAYGLGNAFTFPLLHGRTTILCREKPTPEVIARVFADYKPTIFFAVPVVYRLLLDEQKDHQNASSLDCSGLRLCISAGEALPAAIGEEWEKTFGVPVLDGIGSTEMLHMWMSNHEDDVVYGSSGKLLQGYEARLLGPEGQPTPVGTEGNLWVRGASAAIGYWNRPDTTAATFVNGWVRTGDLYRCDANGYWFHMGRSDDCFKSSGQWVSPVEVEGVLLRHKGISRVAVVEDFDGDGLPCACAFVVRGEASADDPALEQSLRDLGRAALPRYKQPRRYVFVDELPYTATGKIQRFKLRERLKAGSPSKKAALDGWY